MTLHLTDEQLSQLVDGSIRETERTLLEEHLHTCGSCFSAYQDARRYRAVWEADPSIFRAPASVTTVALATPERARKAQARAERESGRIVPSTGSGSWRIWAPALGTAAAVVALVAAMALWKPDTFRQGSGSYAELFVPVKAAVEEASTGGAIMIPGAEAIAATTPVFRSGFAAPSEAVSGALADLAEAYRDESTPPEVAHWLISGFLAVGELENAQLYAEDSRRRYPGDQRFVILEAIVAYRTHDMPRAERLLQLALRQDPGNGTALLNLGLVQYEQGQHEQARRTFELVRTGFAGSPLEQRAAALLSGLLGG